jgi:hypothetical protein
MADTSIQLGGKERTLRFSFLSLKALEQHYNKPIQRVFDENMKDGGLDSVTALLWACLRKEKLTMNKIDELIDNAIENEETTMDELNVKLKEAIESSRIVKGIKTDEAGEGSDEEAKN